MTRAGAGAEAEAKTEARASAAEPDGAAGTGGAPGAGIGVPRAGNSRGGLLAVGKAHLETWRPYTLAYPGLVGLSGAALSGGGTADGTAGAGRLLVAWAAPTLGWVSGHYLGDWFDRALDAIGKSQRPIPSGRLSPRAALAGGVVCAVASASAAALVNWRAVLLVAAAMLGIVAYSRLLKGRGLSGNAARGALTATTVVFGAMTVDARPPWHVLPFAVAFWLQDAASNLVGTLRDVEGDRSGGCRTVPVRRGVRVAVRLATLLHVAALATALAALPLVPADPASCLALLLCAAGCGACAFLPLLRDGSASVSPRRALRAHEILVAERLVLAGALLAGGWTLLPALAVLGPLLAVSLRAQALMRSRHEFPENPAPTPFPEPEGDVTSC